jgi:hypothetical protein
MSEPRYSKAHLYVRPIVQKRHPRVIRLCFVHHLPIMSSDMYLLDDTGLPETLVRSRNVIRARYQSPQWMNPSYKCLAALAVIRSFSKVQIVSLITESLTT